MLSLLVEGLESAWLPCSLILLVPGVAVVLAAGTNLVPALAGFGTSTLLFSWLRFADRGGDWPIGVAAVGLILATFLFLVPLIENEEVMATIAGMIAGAASAELWEPCVGAEFGELLTELPDRSASGIALLAIYVAGVLSPLVGFAAISGLMPEGIVDPLRSSLSIIGGTILAVLAVATAVGLHDDLVGQLIEWSL